MIDVRQQLILPSGGSREYVSLPLLEKQGFGAISRLPVSLRILLEDLGDIHQHPMQLVRVFWEAEVLQQQLFIAGAKVADKQPEEVRLGRLRRQMRDGEVTDRRMRVLCDGVVGAATNVITDHVELRAECRAHDVKFRKRLLTEIEDAFRRAAAAVRNDAGVGGTVKIESRLDYESFQLADDEPCVVEAERAARAAGLAPLRAVSNGGLDANWLSARGIPTVTLGCGQMDVHTVKERLDVKAAVVFHPRDLGKVSAL